MISSFTRVTRMEPCWPAVSSVWKMKAGHHVTDWKNWRWDSGTGWSSSPGSTGRFLGSLWRTEQLPALDRDQHAHLVFLSWSRIFFSISASVRVSSRGHHWSASPVLRMAISTVGRGFSLRTEGDGSADPGDNSMTRVEDHGVPVSPAVGHQPEDGGQLRPSIGAMSS